MVALSVSTATALLLLVGWISWSALEVKKHNKNLQAALGRAESSERKLQEENYAIQIRLGSTMVQDDPSGVLGELLNSLRPEKGSEDARGFEWFYLWNVTSRELHLRGHTASAFAVAVSPDGSRCASGSSNGEVFLWDTNTGELLGKLSGHSVQVKHIAFSHDGRLLVSCATDHSAGDVILWDVETRTQIARLPPTGPRWIWRVAFLPQLDAIGFCGFEGNLDWGMVGLWNPSTGKVDYPIREANTNFLEFALSPSGKLLAAARTKPDAIILSELSTPSKRTTLPGHKGVISGLHFLSGGKTLISGSRDGTIKVWDLNTSKVQKQWEVRDSVTCLRLSPDSRLLAGVARAEKESTRDTLMLWKMPGGEQLPEQLTPNSRIDNFAFSGDGRTIAATCSERHVLLWRSYVKAVSTLKGAGQKEAWSVAFSPDSQTLAVGYDDEAGFNSQTLKTWDVQSGTELTNLPHGAMVTGLAYLPDGYTLASAGYDRQVQLWDTRTNKKLVSLKGRSKRIRTLAASPDGKLLAASGWEKTTRIWSVATGLECRQLPNAAFINCITFAPDGKTLAAADYEGKVLIWDMATGERIRQLQDSVSIFSVAYSPDGRHLATTNRDGVTKLYDLESKSDPRVLLGHKGMGRSVCFSPDGRTLATGGDDRTVRLWHVATGRELLVFDQLPHKVNSLAFSPDGQHLAAALHDGSVRIWHASQ